MSENIEYAVIVRDAAGAYIKKAKSILKKRGIGTLSVELEPRGIVSPKATEIIDAFYADVPPPINFDIEGRILVMQYKKPTGDPPYPKASCSCSCSHSRDCDGGGQGG